LRFTPTERQRLFGLTIAIGGICGLVAVAFHRSIHAVETLTIDHAFAANGDAWVVWLIATPALGALAAGLLLMYVPGARGSGIPQVKVAYASSAHELRLRDALGKFAIGTLQIGTGSSLGREGPTVQICSGVAKGLGRLAGIAPQNLKLLLPVGSAAGIAAAFNAPIAAVTFTIEEIVGDLDQTLLSGVIVAAALAAVVERSLLGDSPVFAIPQGYSLDHASSLVIYAALGIACALVSIGFTEAMLRLRRRFARSGVPMWLRPAIGGLVTGALAVGVLWGLHATGITGGGYTTLLQGLSGDLTLKVMLVLCAGKLVATVFSYSSGGAGGIFAPSLFIGAMLGGMFGLLDAEMFGPGHSEMGAFALVGMGAFFAGTIRAPITSVLIIIEMTGGYGLTLPLMIANMTAYALARHLRPVPIYEALLAQDGIELHPKKPADATTETLTLARIEPMTGPYTTFAPHDRAPRLLELAAETPRQDVFPVVDRDAHLVGLITLEDLTLLAGEPTLGDLVTATDLMRNPVGLRREELASRALETMMSLGLRELPLLDDNHCVLGLIDEAAIAHEFLRSRRVRPDAV
jgi:CIC family chloride channel protein